MLATSAATRDGRDSGGGQRESATGNRPHPSAARRRRSVRHRCRNDHRSSLWNQSVSPTDCGPAGPLPPSGIRRPVSLASWISMAWSVRLRKISTRPRKRGSVRGSAPGYRRSSDRQRRERGRQWQTGGASVRRPHDPAAAAPVRCDRSIPAVMSSPPTRRRRTRRRAGKRQPSGAPDVPARRDRRAGWWAFRPGRHRIRSG